MLPHSNIDEMPFLFFEHKVDAFQQIKYELKEEITFISRDRYITRWMLSLHNKKQKP